jgi:protein AaeX
VLLPVRRLGNRFGLLRHVWHPALFEFAVYLIVVSLIVLAIAHRGDWISH